MNIIKLTQYDIKKIENLAWAKTCYKEIRKLTANVYSGEYKKNKANNRRAKFQENLFSIISNKNNLTECLESIIDGNNHFDEESIETQLKWILGWTLAEAILVSNVSFADEIWDMVSEWLLYDGFDGALTYYLSNKKVDFTPPANRKLDNKIRSDLKKHFKNAAEHIIKPLSEDLSLWWMTPHGYNENPKEYIAEWLIRKDKTIDEFWDDREFSEISMISSRIIILESLIVYDFRSFVKFASWFKVPGQIHQALYSKFIKENYDIILKLIEKSPLVTKNHKWNGNLLCLETVKVAFASAANKYDHFEDETKAKEYVSSLFDQTIKTLLGREDGIDILIPLTKYIIKQTRDNKYSLDRNSSEEIVQMLFMEAVPLGIKDINIEHNPYEGILENINNDFKIFGLISSEPPLCKLEDIILSMYFSFFDDEHKLIELLHQCLGFHTMEFHTSEYSKILPDNYHDVIARLYLQTEQPEVSWTKTWNYMSEMRYNLFKNTYIDGSLEMRERWCFVYCVGLLVYADMLEKSSDGNLEKATSFGEKLWQIIWNYQICSMDINDSIVSIFMRLWGIITYKYCNKHKSNIDIFKDHFIEKFYLLNDYPFIFVDFIEGLRLDTTILSKDEFNSVISQCSCADMIKNGYARVVDYYSSQDYTPYSEREKIDLYKERILEFN